jgi:hypothetical protein
MHRRENCGDPPIRQERETAIRCGLPMHAPNAYLIPTVHGLRFCQSDHSNLLLSKAGCAFGGNVSEPATEQQNNAGCSEFQTSGQQGCAAVTRRHQTQSNILGIDRESRSLPP